MRYLTIQRNKSFVACLMKVKVYVEDLNSSESKSTVFRAEKSVKLKTVNSKPL